MRPRQEPLAGTGGRIRYGRRAAVRSDVAKVTTSNLPVEGWQTRPGAILLNVAVPGEPIPKGRPQHTLAKLYGTGKAVNGRIIQGSGDLRLVAGHTYTPQRTEDAETVWRQIIQARRSIPEPTPEPVGVLAYFQTSGRRADADNLFKLVADAMNGTLLVDDQQIVEAHLHVLRHSSTPSTELLVYSTRRRTIRTTAPDETGV